MDFFFFLQISDHIHKSVCNWSNHGQTKTRRCYNFCVDATTSASQFESLECHVEGFVCNWWEFAVPICWELAVAIVEFFLQLLRVCNVNLLIVYVNWWEFAVSMVEILFFCSDNCWYFTVSIYESLQWQWLRFFFLQCHVEFVFAIVESSQCQLWEFAIVQMVTIDDVPFADWQWPLVLCCVRPFFVRSKLPWIPHHWRYFYWFCPYFCLDLAILVLWVLIWLEQGILIWLEQGIYGHVGECGRMVATKRLRSLLQRVRNNLVNNLIS